MKYTYTGLTAYLNPILKQFTKENIPWEYTETNDETFVQVVSCEIEPIKMLEYLTDDLKGNAKILPIPKQAIRMNVVDETLALHDCQLGYVRNNENSKI